MYQHIVLLMEEILTRDILDINWCRSSSINSTSITILTLNHLHLLEAGPEPNPKIFSYETCCAGMAGVAQFGGCFLVFCSIFLGGGVCVRFFFFFSIFSRIFPCVRCTFSLSPIFFGTNTENRGHIFTFRSK